MPRTIVDILRKGNQELFHSSVIAWLLDPQGEHGYGSAFLDAFARLVEEKGLPQFRAALQGTPVVKIRTEASGKKSRYDIRLDIGTKIVVIENKTKSLGEDSEFETYKGQNIVLVALGLCEMSFTEQVKSEYPLVTYTDVLAMLDGLPDIPSSDFKVLTDHYRQFLRRELAVLAEIDLWYATGDPTHALAALEVVDTAGTYTQNDRRFLNLYLLNLFRRDLLKSPKWKHCRVSMDKNMKSGVWLAVFEVEKEVSVYCHSDAISAVCKEQDASIWFHVELWDGVLAKDEESTAGVIQVRGQARDAKAFAECFRRLRSLREGESYSARMKKGAGSFYVLARPLLRKHLTANTFIKQLHHFAEGLGSFA
jgi:hypothetical protein